MNVDINEKNISLTSIWSWDLVKKSGQNISERNFILKVIAEIQPTTSRALKDKTGIERTNITRCLHDLEKLGKVEIAFIDKCKITNRKVKHYQIKKGGD